MQAFTVVALLLQQQHQQQILDRRVRQGWSDRNMRITLRCCLNTTLSSQWLTQMRSVCSSDEEAQTSRRICSVYALTSVLFLDTMQASMQLRASSKLQAARPAPGAVAVPSAVRSPVSRRVAKFQPVAAVVSDFDTKVWWLRIGYRACNGPGGRRHPCRFLRSLCGRRCIGVQEGPGEVRRF